MLISPNFLASNYCYSKEMKRALERHEAGTCHVIPILVHPAYWEDEPFSHLQMLPTGAKAITQWPDRDEAFEDVARGMSRAIKELLVSLKTSEKLFEEGEKLFDLKRYEEALVAYDQAIRLDPNLAFAYNKGDVLDALKRPKEAKHAYEKARELGYNG